MTDEEDDLLPALYQQHRIRKERKDPVTGNWNEGTRYRVCKNILLFQNKRLVAEASGVPLMTIQNWERQDWWEPLKLEVKKEQRAILANKMSGIVDKALEITADRLEHGDHILVQKTGEVVRKPVPLREAAKVVNDMVAQKMKLEKEDDFSDVEKGTVQDALKMLAQEFAKFNKKSKPTEVIDVEFKDVVNDESNTGVS